MNYQQYLIQSHNYDFDNLALSDIVLFTGNGTITLFQSNITDYSFENVCYTACNYVNNNNLGRLVSFFLQADNGTYMFLSNYLDFFSFYYEGELRLDMCRSYPDEHGDIRDGSTPNNYNNNNYNLGFSDYSYSSYKHEVNYDYHIFDYSNLKYDNSDYFNDVYVVRGENISIYNNYFLLNSFEGGLIEFGYGRPFAQTREESRAVGYSAGYSAGYVQGQEIGFQNGVNSQGVSNQTSTAFSYIGQAFNATGRFLSIEVLPNITLGTCFTIPMVFVLIITIFKLVRK